ncbi:MAG: phosphotransferase [Thermodesulfobacteriota bacterium]|nr:phosphotransferase [Thermodesulfobacteriota bacterium]
MNNPTKNDSSHHFISFAEDYLTGQGINPDKTTWTPLMGDGSDRILYRLTYPEGSLILTINEHPPTNSKGVNENDSFFYICNHLKSKGIALPEIYDFRRDKGWFIIEDLGDLHLYDEVLRIREDHQQCEALYKKVLAILPIIQVKGAQGFDAGKVHSEPYDKDFVRHWESGYFVRIFLKGYCSLPIREDHMAEELDSLAERLSSIDSHFFLYRDFQSKNIMIKEDRMRFIDFQGGRMGPLHYDLASLLIDPYVDLPDTLREKLLEYYLKQLGRLVIVDEKQFLQDYTVIALHRNMQVLGAFAYLSRIKQRKHFIQYIPPAVKNVKKLLNLDLFSPYKKMRKVVNEL